MQLTALRAAAVLMNVSEYETLVEELALLRDVRTAARQLVAAVFPIRQPESTSSRD